MLCLNHGDLNKKGYPDSVCGTWYTKRSTDGCKYHRGHIEFFKYTCCGQGPDAQGCVEGSHNTATYPEEKAKLYFYPKTPIFFQVSVCLFRKLYVDLKRNRLPMGTAAPTL